LAKNNPDIAEKVGLEIFICNYWFNKSFSQVIATIVYGVKHSDNSMNFFRLLTMLVDYATGIPGLPCFTTLVMPKVRAKLSKAFSRKSIAINLLFRWQTFSEHVHIQL